MWRSRDCRRRFRLRPRTGSPGRATCAMGTGGRWMSFGESDGEAAVFCVAVRGAKRRSVFRFQHTGQKGGEVFNKRELSQPGDLHPFGGALGGRRWLTRGRRAVEHVEANAWNALRIDHGDPAQTKGGHDQPGLFADLAQGAPKGILASLETSPQAAVVACPCPPAPGAPPQEHLS